MQTLDNWREWKEKCALGLCGDETKRALPAFVHARFARFIEAYVRATNAGPSASATPVAGETWHRFETHFRLHVQAGGKSYKEWLFAESAGVDRSPQQSIEAGATVLVRAVVREYLRSEYSPSRTVSTDSIVRGDGGSGLTVEDLLPAGTDTTGDVEDRELDGIAQTYAEGAFACLDQRERIAVFVHEAGLSLAHPAALRAADCSKSSLNNAFQGALARIAGYVRERHLHEDRNFLGTLACKVFGRIRPLIFFQVKLEKSCARLCKVIEAQHNER